MTSKIDTQVTDRPSKSENKLSPIHLRSEDKGAMADLRQELIQAQRKILELEIEVKRLEQERLESSSILNRPDFNREVARMLAFSERYGGVSSVVYFDCEHLDEIATIQGEDKLRDAVRLLGDILIRNIRNSDIIGHLGRDEFGVLFIRCDNATAWRKGEELASHMIEGLRSSVGSTIDLSINYGAYTFSGTDDPATGLKEAAHAVTRTKGRR